MLELFTKKPVFQGTDEIHQLDVIYKVLGTPTPERWPGVTTMPWYELVKPKEVIPNPFRDLFKKYGHSNLLPSLWFLMEHVGGSRRMAWSWRRSCCITTRRRGYPLSRHSNTLISRRSNRHHSNQLGKFSSCIGDAPLVLLTALFIAWLRWRANGTNWRRRGRRPGNARRKPQANLAFPIRPNILHFLSQHVPSTSHTRNSSPSVPPGACLYFPMLFFHTFITPFGSSYK